MRLIDADALKREFETLFYNDCGDFVRTERLIDDAPTVEPKWIPVNDRLPEDDEDVLVTRVYTGSTHSFIDMVWFNKGKFLTQDGNLETSNVVAWMPLPKPYKRGDKNDL